MLWKLLRELKISVWELKMSCGEVKIEEKPLRKSSGHHIWRLWRSLGHREATRRASRRSSRAPKLRSMESVKWLWALKEPLAAPKELPRSFLRAKMKVKVAQKSSTEPFESSENDLKIKNVNVHKTIEKSMKIIDFWSSEGQLGAQICIGKALGIRFWGSGGLLDTERRPGEPQGGLQELQSHDPSSLPSDSELPRRGEGHRPGCDLASPPLRP